MAKRVKHGYVVSYIIEEPGSVNQISMIEGMDGCHFCNHVLGQGRLVMIQYYSQDLSLKVCGNASYQTFLHCSQSPYEILLCGTYNGTTNHLVIGTEFDTWRTKQLELLLYVAS